MRPKLDSGATWTRERRVVAFACIVAAALVVWLVAHSGLRAVAPASGGNPTPTPTGIDDGVRGHGQLSVSGARLVGQRGEPVQLRGVSSHGIHWYPEYGNAGALRTLRETGANVFRVAMYSDGSGSYESHPEESYVEATSAVDNALAAGMYVIVDWHVLSEHNPNVHLEPALAFFGRISAQYAGQPGVIYEICNEPNGPTTWQDIKTYANRVIPVIRANSPDAIILVGTPGYSTKITEAARDPLDFKNVLLTFHYYADLSGGGYQDAIDNTLGKNVGVFVSEWGIGNDHSPATDEVQRLLEKSRAFLDYLDGKGISWVSWSLSNKDEGSSLIRHDSRALSDWSDSELTTYGQFVFARLRTPVG